MTSKAVIIPAENSDTLTYYMDSIGCIYTVQLILELESIPDHEQILNAIDKISNIYPILKCHFVPSFWRDSWIEDNDYSPENLLEEVSLIKNDRTYYEEFYKHASDKLDPKYEYPFRIIVYKHFSKSLLVIKMHHSLSDGNGCLQLASVFGKILFGDVSSDSAIPMNRSFGQLIKSFSLNEFPALFKEALREITRPLAIPFLKPVLPMQNNRKSNVAQAHIESINIGESDYEFIRAIAKEYDLTINDYLVCALIKTSIDMRSKFNVDSCFAGALFTVDLRRYQNGNPITLTNYSSALACIVRSKNMQSFPEVAKVVHNTIGGLKAQYPGIGFMWLGILSEFLRLPSGINRFLASLWIRGIKSIAQKCIVFSNVGRMDEYLQPFGEHLKNASFLGPFSNLPLPVFWISGYRSTMTININQIFTSEDSLTAFMFVKERLWYNLIDWPKE